MSGKRYERLKWVIKEEKKRKQNAEMELNRLERETSWVAKHLIKENVRNVSKNAFAQKQIDVLMSVTKQNQVECKMCTAIH